MSVLIANRGEIAIRLARGIAESGRRGVAVFSEDDARSLHVRKADAAVPLRGAGPVAYLDADQLIAAARDAGCDAVHPGYGFLSENAGFATACEAAGLIFVGPTPGTLALFGDKARARALAVEQGVPVLPGTQGPTSPEQAAEFLAGLGPDGAVMLKALAGGGGRGMRLVRAGEDLIAAYDRCRSEAAAAFGNGDLYVERFLPTARHVEVQLVGDGAQVAHLWDRECSLQRQRQKLVEIAPPSASPAPSASGCSPTPSPSAAPRACAACAPSSSWSAAKTSPSSRPTPASKSSTPSPKPSRASTSSACSST
jgi:acetyl/propionyl-CoA carboxylase alpha subunit